MRPIEMVDEVKMYNKIRITNFDVECVTHIELPKETNERTKKKQTQIFIFIFK